MFCRVRTDARAGGLSGRLGGCWEVEEEVDVFGGKSFLGRTVGREGLRISSPITHTQT